MYAIRAVIVLLLILAVVVAYNPGAREEVAETWETIRPAVVEFMDSFYAAIRSLITGSDSHDRIDETPVPGPGVNFERIVTVNSGFSF
ncbi:MAG: hypothetical protein EHM33_11740 [Chloroflexi bacterium]|jgi:hypothetical protein|nr:MAG: hypothetical protein EHM33_11740 [Chloroflexota bacterium]